VVLNVALSPGTLHRKPLHIFTQILRACWSLTLGDPTEEDEAGPEETRDEELIAAAEGNPLSQATRLAATLNQEREPLRTRAKWRNAPGAGQDAEQAKCEKRTLVLGPWSLVPWSIAPFCRVSNFEFRVSKTEDNSAIGPKNQAGDQGQGTKDKYRDKS